MSIESILERIGVEARDAAREIIAGARAEAEAIAENHAGRAEKLRNELEGKARARAAEEENRLIVSEQLELRKAVLAKKREILDHLYVKAAGRLESISGGDFQSLMQELIVANAISGREEIVVAPGQKKYFTTEFMGGLNSSYPGTGSFTVAGEVGDFSWGVVLREGRRAVDLSLDVLFEQLKEKAEARIAVVLFAEDAAAEQ
jgi:V/A-type H+-transporting ATPase subunit E